MSVRAQDRNQEDTHHPRVPGRILPLWEHGRLVTYQLIIDRCPYCGKRHFHGAPEPAAETYRRPHCAGPTRSLPDYCITLSEDELRKVQETR